MFPSLSDGINSGDIVEENGISCADVHKAKKLLQYDPISSGSSTSRLQSSILRTIEYHQQTYYPLVSANSSANSNDGTDRPTVPIPPPDNIIGTTIGTSDESLLLLSSSSEEEVVDEHMNPTMAKTEMDDRSSDSNSNDTTAITYENSTRTKKALCPTAMVVTVPISKDSSNSSNFPSWLRRFAFMQWLIIMALLVIRVYFKTPIGCIGGRAYLHHQHHHHHHRTNSDTTSTTTTTPPTSSSSSVSTIHSMEDNSPNGKMSSV
jgi:hypothetical protein